MEIKLLEPITDCLYYKVIKKWEPLAVKIASELDYNEFINVDEHGVTEPNDSFSVRHFMIHDPGVKEYLQGNDLFEGHSLEAKQGSFNWKKVSAITPYKNHHVGYDKSIPLHYLNAFAIFIGYKSFKDFVNDKIDEDIQKIPINIREQQDKLIGIENKPAKKKRIKPLAVAKHFHGVYEGFFLRPQSDNYTKLTLLIDRNNKVYLKTTGLNELNVQVYQGECETKNTKTLTLKLWLPDESEEEEYEFICVFDISRRDTVTAFKDRYMILKGIYGGSDPTTHLPVAGRMLLCQMLSIGDFEKEFNGTTSEEYYSQKGIYEPEDLSEEDVSIRFNQEYGKGKDKSKKLLDFFSNDRDYIEDIDVAEKYYQQNILNAVNDYSIYSLNSDCEYINRGVAKITTTGKVFINGRTRTSADKKNPVSVIEEKNSNPDIIKYMGNAKLLYNDVLSIIVYEQPDNDEIICYLFKIDTSHDGKDKNYNGVRIMVAGNESNKPFAARVVFIKEGVGFYSENKTLTQIPLFHKENEDANLTDNIEEYRVCSEKHIIKFLTGFENNIIKSFDTERQDLDFIRDINYMETFLMLAKTYAVEKNTDMCLINIYYARLHGCDTLYDLNKGMGEQFSFIKDTYNEYTLNNIIYFDIKKELIKAIKRRLKNKVA